ncbi:hypothetical protein COO60DRAFT_447023 [Scenedesmus sp. NREL 46B-D3]|nr:hypothetical protein COO60DRAFT_447023 [Scenedesmus sp. NREL 46B-D3]
MSVAAVLLLVLVLLPQCRHLLHKQWYYRYWYAYWNFGWYRQYKRNYAPGWSKPVKGIYGRRMHTMQQQQEEQDSSSTARLSQNETMLIPPCLLRGQSYSNTCKQCNYTGVSVSMCVNATRSGVISQLGPNPLGFAAPSIAVTQDGSIVIVTSYSGPSQHPNSTLPAFPGIASLTIAPNSSKATWKVLRTGTGKVKSLSGRWTDFSSIDVTPGTPDAAQPGGGHLATAVPGTVDRAAAAPARLYYGVQWSQREVACGRLEAAAAAGSSSSGGSGAEPEYEPVCAMPAPWIGQLVAP